MKINFRSLCILTSAVVSLMSATAGEARAPLFQLGPISQAVCSQLPVASRRMANITDVLKGIREGRIEEKEGFGFLTMEHAQIASILVPSFSLALSNPGTAEERSLAQRIVTSLANSLSTCSSSLNAQILLPKLVSESAINVVNADCFLPLESTMQNFCIEPLPAKCASEGLSAAARHWSNFKRLNGEDICEKISSFSYLEIEIEQPITGCDGAYNAAVYERIDEQTQLQLSECRGDSLASQKGMFEGENAASTLTCEQVLRSENSPLAVEQPATLSEEDFYQIYVPAYKKSYAATIESRKQTCKPVVVTPTPRPIDTNPTTNPVPAGNFTRLGSYAIITEFLSCNTTKKPCFDASCQVTTYPLGAIFEAKQSSLAADGLPWFLTEKNCYVRAKSTYMKFVPNSPSWATVTLSKPAQDSLPCRFSPGANESTKESLFHGEAVYATAVFSGEWTLVKRRVEDDNGNGCWVKFSALTQRESKFFRGKIFTGSYRSAVKNTTEGYLLCRTGPGTEYSETKTKYFYNQIFETTRVHFDSNGDSWLYSEDRCYVKGFNDILAWNGPGEDPSTMVNYFTNK